jgi:predicted lipid-binding transport protein (Tim44 family)
VAITNVQRRRRFWLRLPLRILAVVFYGSLAAGIGTGLYEHSVLWGFAGVLGFVMLCLCMGSLLVVVATRRTVLRWAVPKLISKWVGSINQMH